MGVEDYLIFDFKALFNKTKQSLDAWVEHAKQNSMANYRPIIEGQSLELTRAIYAGSHITGMKAASWMMEVEILDELEEIKSRGYITLKEFESYSAKLKRLRLSKNREAERIYEKTIKAAKKKRSSPMART